MGAAAAPLNEDGARMVVLRFKKKAPLNRHPFDALYLERLKAGDAETERHFWAYFSDLIRLKVRSRGMGALLDDIRQETFVRVLRTLRGPDGLRDPGALGAFVNAVCGNVILESGRAKKVAGAEPRTETDERPDATAPNAEAQILIEERKFAVRRVIDDLEPRDRELLGALFLEEQDRDRVCARLGVTRDYLRVLVHRAKLEFKARYLASSSQPIPTTGTSTPTIQHRNSL
jgi:RNA polymerase sigma-70 factor, ECF subfamily